LKTNSALRYLWARHRIALLSDYNRLWRQDERVKEVTRLGLNYNLLTAYTSFVAVDTQVRLKGGEAVTIKQPLPLPQGVSDYAVGGGSLAKRAFAPSAGVPWIASLKSRAMDESAEVKEEGWPASEPEKDASFGREIDIELKAVKVSKGMSEKTAREIIKKHIPAFNLCCKQALKRLPHLKGKFAFRLVVDAAGRVTAVYAGQNAGADKMFEQCMIKELKTLCFPPLKAERGAVVNVTFILK
jgi:Ca-activated chloride channel family protein